MADLRSRLVQTLGDLIISNLEMAAAIETKDALNAELTKQLADLSPKPPPGPIKLASVPPEPK